MPLLGHKASASSYLFLQEPSGKMEGTTKFTAPDLEGGICLIFGLESCYFAGYGFEMIREERGQPPYMVV